MRCNNLFLPTMSRIRWIRKFLLIQITKQNSKIESKMYSNWTHCSSIQRMKFRLRASVVTRFNTANAWNYQFSIRNVKYLNEKKVPFVKPPPSWFIRKECSKLSEFSSKIPIKLHRGIATFLLSSEADNFHAKLNHKIGCMSSEEIWILFKSTATFEQYYYQFSPNGSNFKNVAWMT